MEAIMQAAIGTPTDPNKSWDFWPTVKNNVRLTLIGLVAYYKTHGQRILCYINAPGGVKVLVAPEKTKE